LNYKNFTLKNKTIIMRDDFFIKHHNILYSYGKLSFGKLSLLAKKKSFYCLPEAIIEQQVRETSSDKI